MPTHRPIECPHCHQMANIQLVYTPKQVAHLLNRSYTSVVHLMDKGQLGFRYRLKNGWTATRCVDYFQLWDFIENTYPTVQQLKSLHPNTTIQAINRIKSWRNKGRETARQTRQRKQAEAAKREAELNDTTKP